MKEREYGLKPPSREPGQVEAGGGLDGRNMAPEPQVEGPWGLCRPSRQVPVTGPGYRRGARTWRGAPREGRTNEGGTTRENLVPERDGVLFLSGPYTSEGGKGR